MPQRGRNEAEQTNGTKTEQNALEELQEKAASPVTAGDSPSSLLTQHRAQQDSLWGQPTGGHPLFQAPKGSVLGRPRPDLSKLFTPGVTPSVRSKQKSAPGRPREGLQTLGE